MELSLVHLHGILLKKNSLKIAKMEKKISLPNDVRVKGMVQDYQHRKKKLFFSITKYMKIIKGS